MITLITGAPGSGKTLYVVSKLLMPLMGTFVESTDDEGNKVKHPRTVYTNINGLMLPHEKIDAEWLMDWRNRVNPGAIIVPDEAQKMWPKRVTGSKVPQSVQDLETHRHDGVDFIPITQKPELLDQNVTSLAGRHLHVRRVGNSHNAIVYEWDSCSRGLLYKNAFKKSGFRYPRSAFQWYKSAEAHTKMPRALPTALFIAIFALIGTAVAWPMLLDRITSGLDGKPKAAAAKPADKTQPPAIGDLFAPGGDLGIPNVAKTGQEPANTLQAALPLPVTVGDPEDASVGCVQVKTVCSCFTAKGVKVAKPAEYCEASAAPGPVLLDIIQPRRDLDQGFDVTAPPAAAAKDAHLVQWINRDRQPPHIRSW